MKSLAMFMLMMMILTHHRQQAALSVPAASLAADDADALAVAIAA